MAKSLEETLRQLAKQGELNYISVVPMPFKGAPGNVGFSTTYAPASNCGHGFGTSADPVESILEAIADWKSQKRKLPKDDGPKIEAEPVGELVSSIMPEMPKKPNGEPDGVHQKNPWE